MIAASINGQCSQSTERFKDFARIPAQQLGNVLIMLKCPNTLLHNTVLVVENGQVTSSLYGAEATKYFHVLSVHRNRRPSVALVHRFEQQPAPPPSPSPQPSITSSPSPQSSITSSPSPQPSISSIIRSERVPPVLSPILLSDSSCVSSPIEVLENDDDDEVIIVE